MRMDNNSRRKLDYMPYDHVFYVDKNEQLCHATGYEVFIDGEWWNEYRDNNGDLHYGR